MRRFEEAYKIERGANLGDPDFWNRRFEDLDIRLARAENDGLKIDAAVEQLTGVALQRLNDTFMPLITAAEEGLQNLGARFVGESHSEIMIGSGTRVFLLTPETRTNYVVPDYCAIRPMGETGGGIVAQVVSYERAAGLLTVEGIVAFGAGTFDVWQLFITAPPDVEHSTRTDNPHTVTAAQVGAPTIAAMTGAIAAEATERAGAIMAAINALTAGVSTTYDTLAEIATWIETTAGDTFESILTALGNRLRFDVSQSLSPEQKAQAQSNLGLAGAALPKAFIDGFMVSNNAADANNDVDISAGSARSSDDAVDLVGAAMTKRLDAAWAAGAAAGAMQAGSAKGNDQTIVLHAIYKAADQSVDYLAVPFGTVLALPAGYTKSRRIRYVRTDGSANIRADFQDSKFPELVRLKTAIEEVNVANNTTTAQPVTSAAPPNCDALLSVMFGAVAAAAVTDYLRIRPTVETDVAASISNFDFLCRTNQISVPISEAYGGNSTAYYYTMAPASGSHRVFTDDSGQYVYRKTAAFAAELLIILLNGWVDRRLP